MNPKVLKADKDGRPTVVVYKRTVADREAARAERLERMQRSAEIRQSLRAQRLAQRDQDRRKHDPSATQGEASETAASDGETSGRRRWRRRGE